MTGVQLEITLFVFFYIIRLDNLTVPVNIATYELENMSLTKQSQ